MLTRPRGTTILEASIALIVLAGATLSCITLFHLGLRRQLQSSQRVLAVGVAERRLEELRHDALERPGFRSLRNLDAVYRTDPDRPEFEVALASQSATVHSPCSAFDEPGEPRLLDSSAYQVVAVVRWNRNQPGVRLSTLIAEPRTPYDRIQFNSPALSHLPRDGEVELEATLFDAEGEAIPGVKFQFWIKPRSASATLKRNRNGRQVRLINRIAPVPTDEGEGAPSYPGGLCVVTARARYFGQVITANAPGVELQP